MGGIADRV